MPRSLAPHLARVEHDVRTHSHTPESLTYCFAKDGYVESLRLLAAHGRFRITSDERWRVGGFWPEHDPLTSPAPRPSGPSGPSVPPPPAPPAPPLPSAP